MHFSRYNCTFNIQAEDTGCWSYVGKQTGKQNINYNPNLPNTGCFLYGNLLHEIMHALGFYHMQNAADRDDYIIILPENIEDGKEKYFIKRDDLSQFGIPYDYSSIMQYGETAFSKNGEKTIVPKNSSVEIGQRIKLSDKDIARIRAMYEC